MEDRSPFPLRFGLDRIEPGRVRFQADNGFGTFPVTALVRDGMVQFPHLLDDTGVSLGEREDETVRERARNLMVMGLVPEPVSRVLYR